jgi:hypothetical protein
MSFLRSFMTGLAFALGFFVGVTVVALASSAMACAVA